MRDQFAEPKDLNEVMLFVAPLSNINTELIQWNSHLKGKASRVQTGNHWKKNHSQISPWIGLSSNLKLFIWPLHFHQLWGVWVKHKFDMDLENIWLVLRRGSKQQFYDLKPTEIKLLMLLYQFGFSSFQINSIKISVTFSSLGLPLSPFL